MTLEYAKEKLIYEGKAKRIFSTKDSAKLIQEFKDSLTAFNAQKKGSFKGKGEINLKITTQIFEYLSGHGVPNHFLARLNDQDMLVKKLRMIPLEVVVRNTVAGSMSTRLGIPEGSAIKKPVVEFYFKKDELGDPLITDDHVLMLGLATLKQIVELKKRALEINKLLLKMFSAVGIKLIDFKIEFGLTSKGKIILADEISPDSCRLWDTKTNEKLDKDRFRRDLGNVEENYRLICDKITKKWGAK
jgi:phosphoribosylaminoimidazole-succinocarboxamide synthase